MYTVRDNSPIADQREQNASDKPLEVVIELSIDRAFLASNDGDIVVPESLIKISVFQKNVHSDTRSTRHLITPRDAT